MHDDPLLDADGTRAYLGDITPRHLRNLTYRRVLPYVKVGKLNRWRKSDLDRFIESNVIEAGKP